MAKFIRSDLLKFPQIFHTFKAKDNESDEIVEYRIQDLLEEDYDRALDLMVSDFLPEETLFSSRNILSDAESVQEFRDLYRKQLKDKLSVACYKNVEGCSDLVGVNVLAVALKGGKYTDDDKFKTSQMKDVFGACNYILNHHNVFEKYKVNAFLTEYGLVTNRIYRNRGIATQFLKARVPILKALNLQVTSNLFTVIGSQKAAINANFDEVFAIKWTDVRNLFKDFDFSKSNAEFCKIFDFKI